MLLNLPSYEPLLTIVVPAHNEAERLHRLYRQIRQALATTPCRWELVLVDDGSQDDTARIWRGLMAADARLGLVELTRNFGKEPALLAGLRHARGDVVVPMDADLQDPPEVIPRFLMRWRAGYDMVYGVRRSRRDPWWKRLSAAVFYRLLAGAASLEIPPHCGDFRLLDRRVVDALCALPESDRFTRGLYAWACARSCCVLYDRPPRHGPARYRWSHSWEQALAALAFTTWPLRALPLAGVALLLLALLGLLRGGLPQAPPFAAGPSGWSLLLALLLVTATSLCGIGVLGLYLERVLREVKRRPPYLIASSAGAVRQCQELLSPPAWRRSRVGLATVPAAPRLRGSPVLPARLAGVAAAHPPRAFPVSSAPIAAPPASAVAGGSLGARTPRQSAAPPSSARSHHA